jgi:hypothetical protein
MANKCEQWYELTVKQLSFKIGKEADEAWAEVGIIQELKHRPAIFYNEIIGYRIFDKDNLSMKQAKTFHSIHSIAKPEK